MGKRNYRLEFVRTYVVPHSDRCAHPPEWYWRFIAKNGRELARSSETYKRRVDAIASAEATTGCHSIRALEKDGYCWRLVATDLFPVRVNVRWIR